MLYALRCNVRNAGISSLIFWPFFKSIHTREQLGKGQQIENQSAQNARTNIALTDRDAAHEPTPPRAFLVLLHPAEEHTTVKTSRT